SLCGQPARRRHPLSSRRPHRRRAVRLSVGHCPQEGPARSRSGSMSIRLVEGPATERLARIDWTEVGRELDSFGAAVIGGMLTARQCRDIAALYDADDIFRSRIIMGRHGFGSGEYKY